MTIPGEHSIELRHLRYVLAIVDEGSFVAAARRLRVAQPALSRQIAALERRLGVTLFERTVRGARLTAAGRAFAAGARRALTEVDGAANDAREAERAQMLRFALPDYDRGLQLCKTAVDAVRTRYPEAALVGVPMPGPGHEQAVRSGQVDVGFGVTGAPADTATFGADLAFRPLLREEAAYALLPHMHPLAAQEIVAAGELHVLPLASFSRTAAPALYDRVADAFTGAGLAPMRVAGEPSFATCMQMVAAGLAWSFVIRTVADHCPPGTVARRIAGVSIAGVFGAIWRRNAEDTLLAGFVEELQRGAAATG